jgi:ATP-dependent Clp protease ATP-binding subunit ClpA
VVWAPSGSGKGHLLLAAAHVLLHNGHVDEVRHLSAARLTCGRVLVSERDGVLATLLDELADRPRLLLLVDNMDLGVSGTLASVSLLADAFDRGARFLATVQCDEFLQDIRSVPSLARRLLPVRVPPVSLSETLRVLKHLARTSGYDVSPAALLAAVQISADEGATQPAAAIDLLNAAMAEAYWRPEKTITPDDVTSVLNPEWPQ